MEKTLKMKQTYTPFQCRNHTWQCWESGQLLVLRETELWFCDVANDVKQYSLAYQSSDVGVNLRLLFLFFSLKSSEILVFTLYLELNEYAVYCIYHKCPWRNFIFVWDKRFFSPTNRHPASFSAYIQVKAAWTWSLPLTSSVKLQCVHLYRQLLVCPRRVPKDSFALWTYRMYKQPNNSL